MDVFALKQYGSNDGSDGKHHLSLVSHGDFSVCANVDLPFDRSEVVFGGTCRGLVYFQCEDGRIVVCDLNIAKWKVFDLPDGVLRSNTVELCGSGVGYDAARRDYKLIRYYMQHPKDEESSNEDELESVEHMDVYSFNTGLWRTIETIPDAAINWPCAVCVGGSWYWTAFLGPTFGGSEDDPRYDILSLDCSTYTFGHLPFPETSTGEHNWSRVVEYRCLLGALIYWGPHLGDVTCSSPLFIKFFVREGTSWSILHYVTCENVERPLGFDKSKDGSVLFVEGKHNGQINQLMVCDLRSGELKGLGIYDLPSHMIAISFDLNLKPSPPGFEPIPFVKSPSRITSEDEEERNIVSNKCSRMKTKSERRKKKKKTVFEVSFIGH